jgi:anterior pharynx defective protein 1
MYALMTYIAILAQSSGPGVILAPACPNVSLFFLNAIMTFMQSITHVAWMMIAFDGYYTPISAWRIGFVILTHFTTAYATTLNHPDVSLGCIYPLVINGLVMLTSVGLAARRVFRNS